MFYGRETELEDLTALWRKSTASLIACRGRRRIGKSRLIGEFAKRTGGEYIELVGLPPHPDMTNERQLAAFAVGLERATRRRIPTPENWSKAFELLDKAIDNRRRTVVLLDEISWMGGYDPDFPGYLKTACGTKQPSVRRTNHGFGISGNAHAHPDFHLAPFTGGRPSAPWHRPAGDRRP